MPRESKLRTGEKPWAAFGDDFSPSRLNDDPAEEEAKLLEQISGDFMETGVPFDAIPLNALEIARRNRDRLEPDRGDLFFAKTLGDTSLLHDAYRAGSATLPQPTVWSRDLKPGRDPINSVTSARFGSNVLNGRRLKDAYGFRPTTAVRGRTHFLDRDGEKLFDLPESSGRLILENRSIGDGLSVMQAVSSNANDADLAAAFSAYYKSANFQKAPFDGYILGETPDRLRVLQNARTVLSNPDATPEDKVAARNLAAVAIFAEILPINRAKQMVLDALPGVGNYRAGAAAVEDFGQAWDAAVKQGDYARGGRHLLSFMVNAAGALAGVYGGGRALAKVGARLPVGKQIAASYELGTAMKRGDDLYPSYAVQELFGDEFHRLPITQQDLVAGAWNAIKGQVHERHLREKMKHIGLDPLRNEKRGERNPAHIEIPGMAKKKYREFDDLVVDRVLRRVLWFAYPRKAAGRTQAHEMKLDAAEYDSAHKDIDNAIVEDTRERRKGDLDSGLLIKDPRQHALDNSYVDEVLLMRSPIGTIPVRHLAKAMERAFKDPKNGAARRIRNKEMTSLELEALIASVKSRLLKKASKDNQPMFADLLAGVILRLATFEIRAGERPD